MAPTVVATFEDQERAAEALAELRRGGIEEGEVSVVTRSEETEEEETRGVTGVGSRPVGDPSEHRGSGQVSEAPGEMARGAAAGTVAGTALGGVAGFLAGAAAFGIPGVGPAVGTGIWAATFGGAAAGAAAGGVIGGINKTWVARYKEALREGRVLVAVHGDAPRVSRAARLLEDRQPEALDRYDERGNPIG